MQSKPKEDLSLTESHVMMTEVEGRAWQENALPDSAAQVFSPFAKNNQSIWKTKNEARPFIQQHFIEEVWPEETLPKGHCCSERLVLKMMVSFWTAALLFPFLVWGGYVFLPFDAPVMDGTPLRLVYSLRCSVFATIPILLGHLILGISQLRFGELRSVSETEEVGSGDVGAHRSFVSDSVHLFLLYFLQLIVMATYLSQDQLKLVPLLTMLFCFGRLMYWVAATFQSSVRAFGFGISFLPSLTMMAANIYFLVTMEISGSVFESQQTSEQTPAPGRQRFWG